MHLILHKKLYYNKTIALSFMQSLKKSSKAAFTTAPSTWITGNKSLLVPEPELCLCESPVREQI